MCSYLLIHISPKDGLMLLSVPKNFLIPPWNSLSLSKDAILNGISRPILQNSAIGAVSLVVVRNLAPCEEVEDAPVLVILWLNFEIDLNLINLTTIMLIPTNQDPDHVLNPMIETTCSRPNNSNPDRRNQIQKYWSDHTRPKSRKCNGKECSVSFSADNVSHLSLKIKRN